MSFFRAAAIATAAVLWASTPSAQERPERDAACEPMRRALQGALDDAPAMALGNRTKVERLLRDARVAETEELCRTKLRRAHALVEQAYADAGHDLEVIGVGED